jgi:hypothetical protein
VIFTAREAPTVVPLARALSMSIMNTWRVSARNSFPLPTWASPPACVQVPGGMSKWPAALPVAISMRKMRQGPVLALRSGVGL